MELNRHWTLGTCPSRRCLQVLQRSDFPTGHLSAAPSTCGPDPSTVPGTVKKASRAFNSGRLHGAAQESNLPSLGLPDLTGFGGLQHATDPLSYARLSSSYV